jgi:hypothetical protein
VPRDKLRTIDLLVQLNHMLSQQIRYLIRLEPGVQAPDETLVCERSLDGSRSCAALGWRRASWAEMIDRMADDPTPYDRFMAGRS